MASFDPGDTLEGEQPPWEIAKAFAAHTVLQKAVEVLDTPAAELLGQRVDDFIAKQLTLKGGGHIAHRPPLAVRRPPSTRRPQHLCRRLSPYLQQACGYCLVPVPIFTPTYGRSVFPQAIRFFLAGRLCHFLQLTMGVRFFLKAVRFFSHDVCASFYT